MSLLSLFGLTSNDIYTVDTSNAVTPAIMIGLVVFIVAILVITYVLMSIMLSRIFRKAGVEGWKAWVPVYNTWITLELGDQKGWWAIVMLIPVLSIVATVFLYIAMYYIGLRFGKEDYFVLWAIFLPVVWYVWLAFDKSTWNVTAVTATNAPQGILPPDSTNPVV